MSLPQPWAFVKKGQSIHEKMVEQAKQNPERVIAYIESLLKKIPLHIFEDGNLISHLYQVAIKARFRRACSQCKSPRWTTINRLNLLTQWEQPPLGQVPSFLTRGKQ